MQKFLIVGLGNIGPEYAGTRHNAGFLVADALAAKHEAAFTVKRLGSVAEMKLKGRHLTVLKPSTYMNLSGKAVQYWLQQLGLTPQHCLVIVDELALPLNKMRLRANGSAAGHNGLKSIEEVLQTNAYPRLRFGIGNQFSKGAQVDYVLGRWETSEIPQLKAKTDAAVLAIETFVLQDINAAMNRFNAMEFPPPEAEGKAGSPVV